MAKKKRSELKERFLTGKVPSQVDFENLVDSVPNIEDDLGENGFVFYPKSYEATRDNHVLAIYDKDPKFGGKICWSIGINSKKELAFYNADGKQITSFKQDEPQIGKDDYETKGQDYIEVDRIYKYNEEEITVKHDIVFEQKAKIGILEVNELRVNNIASNNDGGVISIEGKLQGVEKLVAKEIKSDSIVTDNATVKNKFDSKAVKEVINIIRNYFIVLAVFEALAFLKNFLLNMYHPSEMHTRGNMCNVLSWLKKKLDANPAMKEMIANYDLKKLVETVDCLDVIKDVNLQELIDRNNLPKLIEKMGLSKLVEKSGILDDAQRTVTLIRKKNEELADEGFHSYAVVVVTNKKPILLCANHTQENAFEIYPTKYVEGDANFKINWVDDHETDEKKLVLEYLSGNPDEYILYGMIKTDMTDNATVKKEFTSRGDMDEKGEFSFFLKTEYYRDAICSILNIIFAIWLSVKNNQKLTGEDIDINKVIGWLKKKLNVNPAMKEMIANYDLKKLVETVDCLNVIKNVNLQAMVDKNDFMGLIEKMDIFKLVEKSGILDDAQRTVTLIRKKNEELADEGFHSYAVVVVTNKKPILLCANHTQENVFEIYPTKYVEGDANFKINWVDDHETDEKKLILEYLPGNPDEYILYGMMKTDIIDIATVKNVFISRRDLDEDSKFRFYLQLLLGGNYFYFCAITIFAGILIIQIRRMLTGGNIDISNVIGLLKKKLDEHPAIKEMIANYDLKKIVETVDCLNVIKNVNLQAMVDKNDFTGLIEKMDIFKLVETSGVLDDAQRTVTLIRKKNEELADEGFHSYPVIVVTNKKPILLCANQTKEKEFEVYPTKYAEGNEGLKLSWVDSNETDEKLLVLEYLPGNPDEYVLYGMINKDLI